MKPKSIRRFAGFQSIRPLALVTTLTAFAAGSAYATDYQWKGTTDSEWTTPTNWTATGIAPTGTVSTPLTAAHRLNVNNAAASKAVYTAAQGTTTYANTSGRGLVIGSGALGAGTMEITGGTFSTLGSTGGDAISNQDNATGRLIINGGNYIGTNVGTGVGIGEGTNRVGILDILDGTATCATLDMKTNSATINLEGGTLAVNKITRSSGTGNFYINGGTLKARQNESAFVSGLSGLFVKSSGAVIDTNGFNVTIGNILRTDTVSTGGGITKNGSGLLTLTQISTTTGAASITAGGLSVVAGSTSWTPSSFTHSGNTLTFNVGAFNPANLAPIDTTAGTGTVTFNPVSPISVSVTGTQFVVGQIPLIKYTTGNLSGFSNLDLNEATLPPGVLATLADNGAGLIYLDVTQGGFVWSGASTTPGTGNWDTTSSNWNTSTAVYANGAPVSFPTIAGGGTITLTENVTPFSVEFSNTATNDYILAGTSKITGNTSVTKNGTGKVSLNNSLNDYSGNTIINAGVVSIASTAALPGWNANGRYPVASGATLAVQNTVADADILTMLGTDNFAAGSLLGFDIEAADRTFADDLSGATGVAVLGTNVLTLSGTNTNTGPIRVSDGTLKAGSTGAFAGTGSLELSGTGTLDLNGYDVAFTSLAAGASSNTITTTATGTGSEVDTLSIAGGGTSFLGEILDGGGGRKIAVRCGGANSSSVPNNANNNYSGGLTLLGSASTGVRLTPFATATNVDENGVVLNGPYGTGPITLGEDPSQKAQIYFNAANRVIANDIIVNTALATDVGASIRLESLDNTISGAIVANQTSLSFGSNWAPYGGAGSITLSGPISTGDNAAAGLSVGSDGLSMVVTLANPNTTPNSYTGDTVIRGGAAILKLGASDQIPNGAGTGKVSMTIDYNSGRYGNLDLNGFNETINGLSGNGRIDNIAATTPSVLTLGDNDATATFGGGIRNTAALTTPAATVSLVKIGTGTQTLGSLTTTHNCGITLDSPTVTMIGGAGNNPAASTAALAPGMLVTGTGIPADTTILAVVNATSFTMSQNATESTSPASLSFTNANSYTGTTSIQAGTLALAATGTIDSSSAVSIAAGAVLQTTAQTEHVIPAGQTVTLGLNAADAGSSGQINATGLDISNATVAFDISNGPLNDPAYVLATYSSLTGTEFLSVPTVPGYTIDYAYNEGTQIALVSSTTSGYTTWAGTNAGGQTPNLDFDNDGVDNGVEYFLNAAAGFTASPSTFASNKATWTNGGNIPFGDYGTQYVIQTSTDLVGWTPVLSTDPNLENIAGSVSYTLNGTGKQFVRLVVTPN